jgi:uncharacterized SAM-binding protein YcdF (DUF218 family)
MIFFLRKFIEALLLPIGISGFLTIAGVVLRRRWLAITGVMVLYLFSTQLVGRALLVPLERANAPMSPDAAPTADAIVVLSGDEIRGVNIAGVQWGETANRYFGGFDLAAAGKARYLVFTGAPMGNPNFTEGSIMRDVAIRHGIQPERILVTSTVQTTEDEARAVSKIPGIRTILLVTSAMHMPRAAMLFRAVGFQVLPYPTDQRAIGRWQLKSMAFIADSKGLGESEGALREYYGLTVYRLLIFFRSF